MKSYLITDPKYYTDNPKTFKNILNRVLSKYKPSIACFRDKTSSNVEQLAKVFLDVCKDNNIEIILINSNINLANKLGFNGVHLTSSQFDNIQKAKDLELFTVISCHDEDELNLAQMNGASMATYSPIFDTPNKGKPCGITDLNNITCKYNIPIIALGGIIDQSHIQQIAKTKAIGFASIRYFIN